MQRHGHARSRIHLQHAGLSQVRIAEDRKELAALWNIAGSAFPPKRGLAYPDIIEAAVARKIRALWIIATNPLVSFPNHDVLQQALSNLDFLVVQDGFHPTPTTELADLVLPAAIWGEKEGTYTNSERRVSKVNKAVEPPGEARTDFDIFLALARRTRLPGRDLSRMDEPARMLSTNGGAFRRAGSATTPASPIRYWPNKARCSGPFRGSDSEPSLRARLYADGNFQTA